MSDTEESAEESAEEQDSVKEQESVEEKERILDEKIKSDLEFINKLYTIYTKECKYQDYEYKFDELLQKIIGEDKFNICKKYEKPPIFNRKGIDKISDELMKTIWNANIGDKWDLTVIKSTYDRGYGLSSSRAHTTFKQIQCFPGKWKLISKNKNTKEDYFSGYILVLQNENEDDNGGILLGISLRVLIYYDSYGDLKLKKIEMHNNDGLYSSSVVYIYVLESDLIITKDDINYYMKLHGENPKQILEINNEISDILENLKNSTQFIKKFLEDIMHVNYYDWFDATMDAKMRAESIKKVNDIADSI